MKGACVLNALSGKCFAIRKRKHFALSQHDTARHNSGERTVYKTLFKIGLQKAQLNFKLETCFESTL
jgi:hypothetical protein